MILMYCLEIVSCVNFGEREWISKGKTCVIYIYKYRQTAKYCFPNSLILTFLGPYFQNSSASGSSPWEHHDLLGVQNFWKSGPIIKCCNGSWVYLKIQPKLWWLWPLLKICLLRLMSLNYKKVLNPEIFFILKSFSESPWLIKRAHNYSQLQGCSS